MYHHPFGISGHIDMIAELPIILNKKCPVRLKFRIKELEFTM